MMGVRKNKAVEINSEGFSMVLSSSMLADDRTIMVIKIILRKEIYCHVPAFIVSNVIVTFLV